MCEPLPDHAIVMGTITIQYWLSGTGEAIVTTTTPDRGATECPVVVQLGMLDLARVAILSPATDDSEDDR